VDAGSGQDARGCLRENARTGRKFLLRQQAHGKVYKF
jgi:hypothetical protein